VPLQPIFTNTTHPYYFTYTYDIQLSWFNCIGASCTSKLTEPKEVSYTASSYTLFDALTSPDCRKFATCSQGTIAAFNVDFVPGCLNCEFTLRMIAAV
jgi:hypothetical protein